MPTKTLVPRASGEGGLGATDNAWGQAYYDTGNFNKGLFVSGKNIDEIIADAVTGGGLGGVWNAGAGGLIYYNGGNVGIGTSNPLYMLHIDATNSAQDPFYIKKGGDSFVTCENGGDFIVGSLRLNNTDTPEVKSTAVGQNGSFTFYTAEGSQQTAERMVINYEGVGIGTTNPSHKLTVDGDLRIKSGDGTEDNMTLLSGLFSATSGSSTIIGSDTKFTTELLVGDLVHIDLAQYTVTSIASDTSMAVNPPTPNTSLNGGGYRITKRELIFADELTSNVGIGTASPSAKFHIVSDFANQYALKVTRSNNSRLASVFQDNLLNGAMGVYNSQGTPKVWLNSSGKSYFIGGDVGIGTENPDAKLEVNSSTDAKISIVRSQPSGNVSGIELKSISGVGINERSGSIEFFLPQDGLEGGYLSFSTKNDATSYPTLNMFDGKVGIGTAAPDSRLSIITDNAPSGYSMKVSAGGGDAGDRAIYIAAGKTTPSAAGDCVYIGFHDGDGTSAGGVRSSFTASTPEFFSGSDVRMKKNIEDCGINGIEKIKSLKLRKWDWNTEKDMAPTDLGLIADELEEVYPELVSRQKMDGWEHCVSEGEEDLKTIPSESKITLTLIKAIQEQQQLIEDLRSEVEALKNK